MSLADHPKSFFDFSLQKNLEETFQKLQFPNARETLAINELGIQPETMDRWWSGEYDPLRVSSVIALPNNRFEIVSADRDDTRRAIISRVFNTEGLVVDLLAVDIKTKWTALYLGSVPLVGESNLPNEPHIGDGLLVHRNGASWLANARKGVIIFDPISGREVMMSYTGPTWPMIVEDFQFKKRLFDRLNWIPSILVNRNAFNQTEVKNEF